MDEKDPIFGSNEGLRLIPAGNSEMTLCNRTHYKWCSYFGEQLRKKGEACVPEVEGSIIFHIFITDSRAYDFYLLPFL
ncbi:hypothetical protein [Brevibacillus formosus]|uniref:hypothetical protein n=1 Tax=Brevibacillus formosus TaxID=54913 RepID=UPI0014777F18|nr:hypothetical protein [Brevibacillus formosus]